LTKSEWRKGQSRQLIAKNITLCAKIRTLCKKQHFCHSLEKAAHKYVDEIDAWWQKMRSDLSIMRFIHPVNGLSVARNMWLILLHKI
jgi:hypothetical protein